MSLNCKKRSTNSLIDLYQYSILEYSSLNAFQIEEKFISYKEFSKDVEKVANHFKNINRKLIQISIDSSYYFAVAYFAVIISNNVAVLSNDDLKNFDKEINIEKIITEQLVKNIIEKSKNETFECCLNYNTQEVCTIIFSSGTMKKPKGIMLSMENIVTTVVSCLNRIMYLKTDKCINVIPQNHIFGLMELLTTIYSGACICVLQSKYQFFNMLERYNPNYLDLPPVLVESLLKQINEKNINISQIQLRRIMCGGSYISDNVIQEYDKHGIKIYRCYGLSEAPCIATGGEYENNNQGVGKLLDCNTVFIDKDGQILVHGKNVMLGYVGNIEQPFVTIDNKKYLKTNDIGKIGIDGNLYIIGRMDNIISLKSGNKISKETIEKRIREIDEIIDCKVFLDKDNICAEVVTDSSDKEMEERILKLTFRRK